MPKAAVIQLTSGPEVAANLAAARSLLEQAHSAGAVIACLPENFALMGRRETDKLEVAEDFGEGPIQSFLALTARELKLWIIGGTAPVRVPGQPGHVLCGEFHLFDAAFPATTRSTCSMSISRAARRSIASPQRSLPAARLRSYRHRSADWEWRCATTCAFPNCSFSCRRRAPKC